MGNRPIKTVAFATNIKIMVSFRVELVLIRIRIMMTRDLGLILNHGTSISSEQKQITPVLCYSSQALLVKPRYMYV